MRRHPDCQEDSSATKTADEAALRLALALGPLSCRASCWPADLRTCFERTWRQEHQRPSAWRLARRPGELLCRMQRLVDRAQQDGGYLLFSDDPTYPRALLALRDAPAVLFCRGAQPPLERGLAIVGARAAYRAELDRARDIARELTLAGHVIVSGGALGIDAAAHEGALDGGGATIAVLGNGLDRPYPSRNRELFTRIAESGWMISPFCPGESPKPWHFPRRNSLIAALGAATLVVSAGERSGALDTAAKARRLQRLVVVVPKSAGCKRLAAAGAAAINSADDLLALLAGRPTAAPQVAGDPLRILRALERERGTTPDDVARRAGIAVPRTAMLLLQLELAGLVLATSGGLYTRLVDA